MTRTQMMARISSLREELEYRVKHGISKNASPDASISVEDLQKELYFLIYRVSKFE